jgi:hypothetical protein
MDLTSPELKLAVVGLARALLVPHLLPRKFRRDPRKLIPSSVGVIRARHRQSTVVPCSPATALVAIVVRVGRGVRFVHQLTRLVERSTMVPSPPNVDSPVASFTGASSLPCLCSSGPRAPLSACGREPVVGRAAPSGRPSR